MNWPVWVALLAVVLGSLFSALHFSLRSFSLRKLEDIAEDEELRRLSPILEEPDGHALAIGALRVLCNVAMVVSIVLLFGSADRIPGEDPGDAGRVLITLGPWGVAGAMGVATAVLYTFGFVVPMSLADHLGERLILMFRRPIRLVYALAWPLRAARLIDIGIKRLAGVHLVTDEEEHREELLDVVTEGEREGNIDEAEREMIEAVVSFADRTAGEIMTPRTEVEGLAYTQDLEAVRAFIEKSGHSRIPVYEDDLDHILGVLYAKDLLRYVGRDASGFNLRSVLRQALFVPKTKPLNELLDELRARKVHIAIVLDEYGGTAGLVTFEDVLEVIVGEIYDEYEPPEISDSAVDAATRSAEIDARAYIEDANQVLEAIGVEIPEGEDYETVGGYVLSQLGHIPVAGELVLKNGHKLTVLEAEPTRVLRVRIEPAETGPATSGAEMEPEADAAEARQA